MSESNAPEMKWYIIQTQSGFEAKACTALKETAKRFASGQPLRVRVTERDAEIAAATQR